MLLSWSKERRFYNVQLQANLFGGISVFCSWGSIDSKQGSCIIIYCDNEQDVDNALQVIKKRRKARGYRLTD
jgi:predicted DNA-binding WGR domain protein